MLRYNRPILILVILFGYVLLQFIWWEILLVQQVSALTDERQKILALSVSSPRELEAELAQLEKRKRQKIFMFVGEGTVFLLLLLFGVHRIKKAHDKEQELNQRQKNFFLSITHELKTPLASTKLQLQTLRRLQPDENTRQELIGHALMETERLNDFIDNILLASRLESAEMQAVLRETDLSKLAAEVLSVRFAAAMQEGRLTSEIAPGVTAKLDPVLFPSVITNLVDNALKYSGSGQKVSLQISGSDPGPRLVVKDTGQGIAPGDREKIFRRFYRSGDEHVRRTKGTGLGLYIVKDIVTRHHGKIRVYDNAPSGTVFEVRLPKA